MTIDYQNLPPTERQRLPEYKREDDFIKSLLHRGVIGHVAHSTNDQPFITPTNYWYDELNHRIIFHSNVTGRIRSNLENQPKVCFETSEYGRFLPSNAALEFSIQYRSVMVFGKVALITDPDDQRSVLTALLTKYFPTMHSGVEYRPITDKELAHTSVYAIEIESWSGKENWNESAEQIDEWPPVPEDLL